MIMLRVPPKTSTELPTPQYHMTFLHKEMDLGTKERSPLLVHTPLHTTSPLDKSLPMNQVPPNNEKFLHHVQPDFQFDEYGATHRIYLLLCTPDHVTKQSDPSNLSSPHQPYPLPSSPVVRYSPQTPSHVSTSFLD